MIGYGGQGFLNVDIVVKTNMNLIDRHVKKTGQMCNSRCHPNLVCK